MNYPKSKHEKGRIADEVSISSPWQMLWPAWLFRFLTHRLALAIFPFMVLSMGFMGGVGSLVGGWVLHWMMGLICGLL
ncbi:MAG: hypothetical protein EPO28_03520 [Saprospiraceae bacterium]|nr:MAG: hypothetical protein EPO28_03520 [Saprospiraceae bacterium]